jgi:glycosyltransferase involved in cell wall biosynthesis
MSSQARQRASHQHLVRDDSRTVASSSAKQRRLNAIIVPTIARAEHLRRAIELAAQAEVLLVVLASRQTVLDEVADEVSKAPCARALIVQVPEAFEHHSLTKYSNEERFQKLNGYRQSDLSPKRNIGLLLARLLSWDKILFLDDDIAMNPGDLARVASRLEDNPVAGFSCAQFPDNSVVCHANRLSGARQAVFVSGAALGISCTDHPLSYFPDIYNEDWFFLAQHVASRRLSWVGNTTQRAYQPFAHRARATTEEFGDLLAEGLYASMGTGDGLPHPSRSYWEAFIQARSDLLDSITGKLWQQETNEAFLAIASLDAAREQLTLITPGDCQDFLEAFREDRQVFGNALANLPTVTSAADALEQLGLTDWRSASFGNQTGLQPTMTIPQRWSRQSGRTPVLQGAR